MKMVNIKQLIGGFLILIIGLFAAGCTDQNNGGIIDNTTDGINGGDNNIGGSQEEGLLIVKVRATGMNESFERVALDFTDVEITPVDTGNVNWGFNNWFGVLIGDNPVLFEQGDETAKFVVAEEINTGNYQSITVEISDATAYVNGEETDLNVVNEEVTIDRQFTITSNQTTTLVLDLNLANMIGQNQQGNWDFNWNNNNVNWFQE